MRLRSGYQHAQVIPASITVLSTTNSDLEWMLILNPTVTGTAFSYSTVTNSAVEADVTRTSTTTVSGGTVLAGGYIAANGSFTEQLSNDLTIGVSIAGVSDVLVLAARRITGTSEALFASLTWHETQ